MKGVKKPSNTSQAFGRFATFLGSVIVALTFFACNGESPTDPHVIEDGRNLERNQGFISPPTLQHPIYQCASSVVVKNFIPGAKLDVFVDGNPAPIGSTISWLSTGQNINVSISFTVGQVVTATQTFDGVTSTPSNAVPVTSHLEDYPSGLPKPRLAPTPLYECGRAVGFQNVIPGAWVKVYTENPATGGGFDPPVLVGSVSDFGYTFISPPFVRDARVWAESGICSEVSPRSDVEIVQPAPAVTPAPSLDPVHEGTNIVTVWGPGGNPNSLLHGAALDIFADNQPPGSERVGGQPTPGGGQQVYVNPAAAAGAHYTATQALCATSPPSPPTEVVPCRDLPPAKIKPPLPGDTQIVLTEYVPGSRILVFANGVEIGDSGPPVINLSRPVEEGEEIRVLQLLGTCESRWVYVIKVECASLGGDPNGCSGDWPAFRHNALRNAQQTQASALSDPYQVKKLKVKWSFTPPNALAFRASPIVWKGKVYIGNGNGYLYALDAATGTPLWQYPAAGDPPLDSQFHCNPSSYGIASSATIATIDQRDFVIFAAPDQSIGAGLGSGRVFALDANIGSLFWASPEVAVLNGLTAGSLSEFHEQIGYSSPLVFGNRVYVGIANHCDNPIQNGRVAALDLTSGALVGTFDFKATNTRGGGVWSSVAGGLDDGGIYITTGNVSSANPGGEPRINHALGLLRLNASTGAVVWKLQPVPFELDFDPDWASGATLITTSCGSVVVSTMKDGWTYAVNAGTGAPGPASVHWQFPATGFPFSTGDGTLHGDTRYLVPGAAWNEVFITMTGGENVIASVTGGYTRLHALNVCAGQGDRVRWVVDVPGPAPGGPYRLGPPTVTHGIIFVGTSQGRLVAIADPSVWATGELRCSNPDVLVDDCVANGFHLIPKPIVLLNIDLDSSSSSGVYTEPVLAGGRVYVATGFFGDPGTLYTLEPEP